MDPNKQWFAVRTKAQMELVARLHYERQNYHVYLPLISKIRRHARKQDEVLRPLFPGYLFLHLAPTEQNWVAISSTIGTISPVHFGEYYPPVPDHVIEKLQTRHDESGIIPLGKIQQQLLKQGSQVDVDMGNLGELKGVFQGFRGEDRVLVLLDILKRQVPTVVPVSDLRRVEVCNQKGA